MKLPQILKEIKKHSWWIEECPATHQAVEWAWRGFIESSKYFHKDLLSLGVFIYRNDFGSEITPRDEKIEQFYFTLKKYRKNRNYLAQKKKIWDQIIKALISDGWKMLNKIDQLSCHELASAYKNFSELNFDHARYAVFIECDDPFTEDELPKILKKELPKISDSERGRIAVIMSSPSKVSFMDAERSLFLKSCLEIIKDKRKLESRAGNLAQRYFWMMTHYGRAITKRTEDFKKEILGLIKKKSPQEIKKELKRLQGKIKRIRLEKRKILKKYRLSKELIVIFKLISEMGVWTDERKGYVMQVTYQIYQLMDRLEEKLRVPARLLSHATCHELFKWIQNDKNAVNLSVLKQRRKFSVYYIKMIASGKSRAEFIVGRAAKIIYNNIFKMKNLKEFKGTPVFSSGRIIRGRASLILNTTTDRFKDGDILVTTMTRPDFLPLMRRAKAIVTDEGGLTCHAAIISRELKIPCVIGTKIATRVLRDGDLVEVDANKGVVKILKRHE